MKAFSTLLGLLVAAASTSACRLPDFVPDGLPGNVAAAGGHAVVALGGAGFAVRALGHDGGGSEIARVAPPAGSDRVDDVALDGSLLFALDAKVPGAVSVWSLADPTAPRLVAGPRGVPVGPFSGVAAAGGRVVVSGGTSELTLLGYDRDGRLSDATAALDLGRGQPDVLLAGDGRVAVVSTHFSLVADTFGFTTLALGGTREAPSTARLAAVVVPHAGYAPGGARPASFPLESAWSGRTLLLTAGRSLARYDLADPAAPRPLASIALPFAAVNVDADATLAVAVGSDPQPMLAWIDLSDPAAPRLVATLVLPDGDRPTSVALTPRGALVAAGAGGVRSVARP